MEDSILKNRQVWLTSFWGWSPESWGCVGWTKEGDRENFLHKSNPGDLIVIYVTKNCGNEFSGKIAGVYEISHMQGDRDDLIDFNSHKEWLLKDEKLKDKWQYALQATRAWDFTNKPLIDGSDGLPETYRKHSPLVEIAVAGVKVESEEAYKLLQLQAKEVPVYQPSQLLQENQKQTPEPEKQDPRPLWQYFFC